MGKFIFECPICENKDLFRTQTKISDFVRARIGCDDIDINLYHCKKCEFAFYDYRFSTEDEGLLYADYRSEKYQKQREQYECWYTEKVNRALNSDINCLREQQRVINKVLNDNGYDCFDSALDYGGNEGATFIEKWGKKRKYVFDISGCEVRPGIIKVDEVSDLFSLQLDFVMCNMTFEHLADPNDIMCVFERLGDEDTVFYIEVPSEFPYKYNKFALKNNVGLLLNFAYSNLKLFRYYMKKRKEPFFTMKEHINFYTPQSIEKLVEKYGFSTMDVQENYEMAVLGKQRVLSILFKR